jgi:hypothetical protein
MSTERERHRWWLTPTALFRSHMPPVFLRPVHWLDGCWTCAPRSPHAQELLELQAKRRERERAKAALFKFAPGPTVGELRDVMAAVHPCHGGSEAAFTEMRGHWLEARRQQEMGVKPKTRRKRSARSPPSCAQ